MADGKANPSGHPDSANSLIRRLGRRYLVVLALVALLMVADQAVVQPLLVRLDVYAPAINLAGRQRMLSQKLAKAAWAFKASDDENTQNACLAELVETLEQWSRAQDALLSGDPGMGIHAVQSPEIAVQWNLLQPHFDIMCAAVSRLIGRTEVHSPDNTTAEAVSQIVGHEAAFLTAMDRIVKLMEGQAAHEINRLRACSLAIAVGVMSLLIGLGSFVVRPATRTIRHQVNDLEASVAQRTRELANALSSLRRQITEREASESKNKALAAQLNHADRIASMGHLTISLAHELNQPLGAIANYAEACDVILGRHEELSSQGRLEENVGRIKQASLRAGQIVRRIRNFVQANPGTIAVADINVLVHEVVALCRQEMIQSQVKLTLELSANDGIVMVDSIQIQQVLVNLVQNALQAMQGMSADNRRLRIQTSRSFDIARVDVSDSGPGFAADQREKMFEPFHTTKMDGLGIGLAICRSIIGDHDGTIWAESIRGNGAQVSFTLPLTQPHDAGRRIESDCVCG